jgi:hypothetical protein
MGDINNTGYNTDFGVTEVVNLIVESNQCPVI